jgi:hypothetical protein
MLVTTRRNHEQVDHGEGKRLFDLPNPVTDIRLERLLSLLTNTDPIVCIFCGTGKPTREHIFGRWMRHYIDVAPMQTKHTTSYFGNSAGNDGPFLGFKNKLNRNGAPTSHQLRVVCPECNSGWMGTFQENGGKKYLPPLLNGEWPFFTRDAMHMLSSWATMVTMVLEFADSNTITISDSERQRFKENLYPPETFQVYLGLYVGEKTPGSFYHRSVSILDNDHLSIRCKMQATTIHLALCFFHVVSGPADYLPIPPMYSRTIGMAQLWPIPELLPPRPAPHIGEETWWAHTKFFSDLGLPDNAHGDMNNEYFHNSLFF